LKEKQIRVMNRQQTNYNKPVAISESREIYILNYTFEHEDGFQGATGTVLVGLTQEMEDFMYSDEHLLNYYDSYREVFNPDGTKTDEQFLDEIRNEINYGAFEPYERYWDDEELLQLPFSKDNNFVAFEVVGAGRCFDYNQKFETILDQQLIDIINQFEFKYV
jgi:hypothetical protein